MIERIEVPSSELADIVRGVQTTSVQRGSIEVEIGQVLPFSSYDHAAEVEVKVDSITLTTAGELSLGVALSSGYPTVDELLGKLGNPKTSDQVYVVAFSRVERS